jgi:hypothetical protein
LNLKNICRAEGVEASLKPLFQLGSEVAGLAWAKGLSVSALRAQVLGVDLQIQLLHDSLLKYSPELMPADFYNMSACDPEDAARAAEPIDHPPRKRALQYIQTVFEALLVFEDESCTQSQHIC